MKVEVLDQALGPYWPFERIEVVNHPVASNLDAMHREWDLGRLSARRAALISKRPGNPKEARTLQAKVRRVERAMKTIQGHLAVWKVQQS